MVNSYCTAGGEVTATEPYLYRHPHYAEALRQALFEDPFYICIESVAGRQALLKYLDYSIVEGQRYGESFIPQDDAYGVSVWSKPLPAAVALEQKKQKTDFLRMQLGDNYLSLYEEITEFMSTQSEPLIDQSAWYLSIIGVLPHFQNKGLGKDLVRQVLDRIDVLQVPSYLETFTPRNESFYQRLGYQVVERPFEPTLQATYAIMLREC